MKLTEWFPADVKPVRVGWYEVKVQKFPWQSEIVIRSLWWSGSAWCSGNKQARHWKQPKKWRGVESP